MACRGVNNPGAGVTAPIFRIKVNGRLFEDDTDIFSKTVGLFKKSESSSFLPLTKELMDFIVFQHADIKKIFRTMSSGKYVFCSIKSPANFKLVSNSTFIVNERYKEVEVLRLQRKTNDIELEMSIYDFNRRSILEYLFFIVLYRYKEYTTFTVMIDFVNNFYNTIFGYNFVDCIFKSAEVYVDQEFDEFGNIVMTKTRPFKFRMSVRPYDVVIRI